jgi:hypothetical protein
MRGWAMSRIAESRQNQGFQTLQHQHKCYRYGLFKSAAVKMAVLWCNLRGEGRKSKG